MPPITSLPRKVEVPETLKPAILVLLQGPVLSLAEIYKKLCDKGYMTYDPDIVLYPHNNILEGIGALVHELYVDGQLSFMDKT